MATIPLNVIILLKFVPTASGFSFTKSQCGEVGEGLTSHQTHYKSYWGRVFKGSNNPTNSVKALKEAQTSRNRNIECQSIIELFQ